MGTKVDVVEVRALDGRSGPRVTSELRGDGVLLVRFSSPPVNALSRKLQSALLIAVQEAFERQDVRAVVLWGDNRTGFFSSGADINEFGKMAELGPVAGFGEVYYAVEQGPKPVVAAIDGICFGGALELAMACSGRIATPNSSFSLPELKLGLIPGLGGTQRLPRLVGFEKGMRIMLTSTVVRGEEADSIGLVHSIVSKDQLIDAAAALASQMSDGSVPKMVASEMSERVGSVQDCKKVAKALQPTIAQLSKGGKMPQYAACLDSALFGVVRGSKEGLQNEGEIFFKLVQSPTAKSLIHVFFAERATTKVDIPNDGMNAGTVPKSAAIVGGGLMGAGIATAMIRAGIAVTIKEINDQAAEAAIQRVMRNLKSDTPPSLLSVTTGFQNFDTVDIVIEAAVEDVQIKQDMFKELQAKTKGDCILATNTSTINIDLVAAKCSRAHAAGRVAGAHFFSPAHKMPLLEIVRTDSTSPKTINSLLLLAKKIKKTPIVVGNCAGFCVNRMYFPQGQVADMMCTDMGINPYKIDKVMEEFGLPMGPFRLLDLVGLDIGLAIGKIYNMAYADRSRTGPVLGKMIDNGWKGQKTGHGYYSYDKKLRGVGQPDAAALSKFIPSVLKKETNVSDEDIVDMILLPCVNEACRLLAEGVAAKSSDVDIGSIMGMAFPAFRGGLLFWAMNERGGAGRVFKRLERFYEASNRYPLFRPSFALARAASLQLPIGIPPTPMRETGDADDVVVVAAFRTAVGRAGRGGLKDTPIDDMISAVASQCLKATGVPPSEIDDLVIGTVLGKGDDGVIQTRVGGLLAGLPVDVPCKTVNRLCSSGLQAIADAAAAIREGYSDIVLAGGSESMSLNSFVVKDLKPNPKAKGEIANCYLTMGATSENVAARFGISRERQDRMGVVSHARASAAMLSGKQRNEIVPMHTTVKVKSESGEITSHQVVVERDEGVRVGVTMEKLAKLKPVFQKDGSSTAGNSSQLSDGTALTMLMRRSEARRRGLTPLGTFKAFAVAGVDPAIMGIGPVAAIPKVLEKANLDIEDIDLWEINEAFGSQADYSIEHLGINRDIVNVNGGAIAIGHPLGMTGARTTVSLLHEMQRRKARYGVVSMCIGTGMGAAAVYEINSNDKMCKL